MFQRGKWSAYFVSYLSTRKGDGSEVFDVKDDRHLEDWINQPVDVDLVIRHYIGAAHGEQGVRGLSFDGQSKLRLHL